MMAPCVAERGRRNTSGVEYNVPFREESCRSSCIYSGPLHSHSRDAVSQHPSTRAGAESIQLIYSGRALQALSDLTRQFRCHTIFWRKFIYSHHSPSPYPPLLTTDQHPPCPLAQLKTIWLGLPPSIIMGARQRNLRLAHGSADTVNFSFHYWYNLRSRAHLFVRRASGGDSTSTHTLVKYTKEPWLFPSPPLTKELSSVGRT